MTLLGKKFYLLTHLTFITIEGGAEKSCVSFSSSSFVNCDKVKGPKGKGSSGGNSRIVGGTETKPNAYPSAVTLQQTDIDDGTLAHYCTAVLIHESWVSIPFSHFSLLEFIIIWRISPGFHPVFSFISFVYSRS